MVIDLAAVRSQQAPAPQEQADPKSTATKESQQPNATASSQAESQDDSFLGTVSREAKHMAVSVGNATSSGVGGMLGLAFLTAGLYVGVAGGAIFLGALGGGLGPVVSAVTTKGLLNFVAGTFKTAGLFAKAGMVTGGLSVGIGGFKVGHGIGELAGFLPGAVIGYGIGLVKGAVEYIRNKGGEE